MKLYTAAIYTNGLSLTGKYYERMTPEEQQHRQGIRYILESYHYVNNQAKVDAMRADGVKVFLDSGAFSAYTQGVKINIDEYCNYIHKNSDIIDIASVLDAVGDPSATLNNQAIMEENGCKPLPCYHYGEDETYLVNYLNEYEYITRKKSIEITTLNLNDLNSNTKDISNNEIIKNDLDLLNYN